MHTANLSIENYKLKRLTEDLEALEPGTAGLLGKDAIIAQLRPVVAEALARGCSTRAVMTLVSGYGLELDSRELGIFKGF